MAVNTDALLAREQLRQSLGGMSVTDAADALGIGRPALSSVLNGKARVSVRLALKAERLFGLHAEALLHKQLAEVIAAARAKAGHPRRSTEGWAMTMTSNPSVTSVCAGGWSGVRGRCPCAWAGGATAAGLSCTWGRLAAR